MTAAPAVVPLEYDAAALARALGDDWTDTLRRAYRWMLLARALDARMLGLQRQGRVGFYGPATGQEAVSVAAGLASRPADWVVPGLREQLVALVRGHPLETYVDHLFANARDPAVGRQMPCHPTARGVRYVSMSSVVGTQIGHAVGLAYALRRAREDAAAFAFFGDGATSANDFHAGMNMAAVLGLPVVFVLTNNQWAISVPVERQSAVAHLAHKAAAYGIPGARVDGTDFVAVYAALADARARAARGEGPRLLETVVYRLTPHSSSDDPTRYQSAEWLERGRRRDPVARLRALLVARSLLNEADERSLRETCEAEVRGAVEAAERVPAPGPETLFEDVFASASGDR
jgi:pyruvate dehydrogenase E1 component alpha subunit/2-oxoisovalerate dehydrogenase E1 component alpha subunit